MPKIMDENDFKEKLDFIGLKLEKLPKFLSNFEPIEFVPSNSINDNEHKIFKYIPIQDIQILISPTNRLDDIRNKYKLAKPIGEYLDPNNIEEYATFLRMLNMISPSEIEEIEKKQDKYNKKVPYAVQYSKDYIWQIYYSQTDNKYFMIVTSEDYNFDNFFYILKEQIKYHKSRKKTVKYIFAPVNCVSYSGEFLKKSEIADIENYLWLFTKNWPNVYEIYDKDENRHIEIIGATNIYKSIKSGYKIILNSKSEATKLYKELKALFILQTELPLYYKFDTRINNNCKLEIYFNSQKIDYNNILNFIDEEYSKTTEKIKIEKNNVGELEKKLEELKEISTLKDIEYIKKQKEIAIYLEYKKTFFGKIRLFLKFKKKKNNSTKEEKVENEFTENSEFKPEDETIKKEHYTIEDLVIVYSKYEKEITYIKNMKSDIHALELKIKNIEKKIENATKYIEEIENHKKSIFEFWRFVNKDELLAMEEGSEKQNTEHEGNLQKTFNYELDFIELGTQMDKLQRKLLGKDILDSTFLLDTKLKKCINAIKSDFEIDIDMFRNELKELKDIFETKKKTYRIEDFDIFGNISDNSNKVKILANKKHRETQKDILTILNISSNTDLEEFRLRLQNAEKYIEDGLKQIKSGYQMPIYIATEKSDTIDKNGFGVFHIAPENALKEAETIDSDKINLYKLDILEGMPLLYFSNIIYYNNFNETLPLRNEYIR